MLLSVEDGASDAPRPSLYNWPNWARKRVLESSKKSLGISYTQNAKKCRLLAQNLNKKSNFLSLFLWNFLGGNHRKTNIKVYLKSSLASYNWRLPNQSLKRVIMILSESITIFLWVHLYPFELQISCCEVSLVTHAVINLEMKR